MNKNYIQYKKLLHSARGLRMIVLFVAFLILFGLLGFAIAGTYDQTVQKDKQLAVLEQDLKNEEEKNASLKAQKDYYTSDTYIEKEARDTLGLSFPNEQIYVLKKDSTQSTADTQKTDSQTQAPTTEESSFSKWLKLIFG